MNHTLPQVFNNTLRLWVWYVFLPGEGAVSMGMGVVSLSWALPGLGSLKCKAQPIQWA